MKSTHTSSKLRSIFQAIICLLLAIILASPASAISDETWDQYGLIGVYYYNPEGFTSNGCIAVGSGDNVNYAGDQVWRDYEMQLILKYQSFYEEGASAYNFPWQLLAVLHSVESGLSGTNPKANPATGLGEGIFQLHSYASANQDLFTPGKVLTDEEIREQVLLAAKLINSNYGNGLELNTPEGVKEMFFRYNGTASKYKEKALALGFTQAEANIGEGSPYVMNRYDAQRDPTSPEMNPNWPGMYGHSGYIADYEWTGFGTFVKFEALGGISGICGVGNGDINATALELAWPEYRAHGPHDPKPEYQAAINAIPLLANMGPPVNYGASCDAFVTTVMRTSGADPDFPCCGVGSTIYPYLTSHPEKYDFIGVATDSSLAQPGDIRIRNNHHIELVVQLEDGTMAIASASISSPARTGEIGPWYNSSNFEIYRLK